MHAIMRTPVVFDGRNLYDPERMREFGFTYHSIGRSSVGPDGPGTDTTSTG